MFNRNFVLILAGNIILGSAMPLLIILGGLAGAWLAPQEWLATAPPSAQMLAGIVVASPISLFMGRFGRRAGFHLGAAALISGSVLAVLALQTQSFTLLCLAHVLLGAALICVNYFRFAAAETVSPAKRPQAISFTLASGLVAALIGPELFSWSKDYLAPTPLAGAYAAMAALGLLGTLPVAALNLPVPPRKKTGQTKISVQKIIAEKPQIPVAITLSALSQAMMILLMVPTPLAMVGCGFAADQAADVIRWHVVAMFAPGFFTGTLIARFGAGKIATLGMALLLMSAVTAWSSLELLYFYVSLLLLGLGWNFGFVSGTHLLQSALTDQERPLFQGINDTVLAIASSAASLASGVLYTQIGWAGLATFSAPALFVPCLLLLAYTRRQAAAS